MDSSLPEYYYTNATPAPATNSSIAARPEYAGTLPPLVRPPEDQDFCLQAAAKIRDEWIQELNQRNEDMRLLRPIIVRHRQWLIALAIVSILSLFALGLVLSWYIPLKIRTNKQQNNPSPAS